MMFRAEGIYRAAIVTVLAAFSFGTPKAEAGCLNLIKGPIVFDVKGCKKINPETDFDFSKTKYKWIKDLDPAGRKDFLNSYRGLYLKGQVVKSQAKQVGVGADGRALAGQDVFLYMPPSPNQCANVNGKRLSGRLTERCCDGGGDIPCLLGSSYLFLQVKSLGNAGSAAGDDERARASRSPQIRAGNKHFANRQWKKAVSAYLAAMNAGEIDVRSRYKMGMALRELDNCRGAIKPLRQIYDANVKGNVWADEEPIVRKSNFLLARCYSKVNDPQNAVLVLNGYLLEPKKYRRELREGLRHKDFGWIQTSKEYRDWAKAPRQKK